MDAVAWPRRGIVPLRHIRSALKSGRGWVPATSNSLEGLPASKNRSAVLSPLMNVGHSRSLFSSSWLPWFWPLRSCSYHVVALLSEWIGVFRKKRPSYSTSGPDSVEEDVRPHSKIHRIQTMDLYWIGREIFIGRAVDFRGRWRQTSKVS